MVSPTNVLVLEVALRCHLPELAGIKGRLGRLERGSGRSVEHAVPIAPEVWFSY